MVENAPERREDETRFIVNNTARMVQIITKIQGWIVSTCIMVEIKENTLVRYFIVITGKMFWQK